jgi:ABC-type dipeptide/oligopeptide/nickel transport system ATPase subunit
MTSMLDALTQAHIWQIILNIARNRRLGLLVISHDTTLLTRLCSRNISYFEDTAMYQE